MNRTTKEKGELAEAKLIAKFLEEKIPVSKPFGDNCPYDLIIDFMGKLSKVQCKYGRFEGNGRVTFNTCKVRWNSAGWQIGNYKGSIDYFAVWCEVKDSYHLIPIEHAQTERERTIKESEFKLVGCQGVEPCS